MDLTLPSMTYFSPGPDNHLTKAYWNRTSGQLMSGCTVYGDTVTPQMAGGFPPYKAVGGPNCTKVKLARGGASAWIEVGSNFDTLMFGTWAIPRLKHCLTSPGAGATEGCPANRTSNFSVSLAVVKDQVSRCGGGGATIDRGGRGRYPREASSREAAFYMENWYKKYQLCTRLRPRSTGS
eukprot:SAG22_NODE_3155_length_1898_cov_1.841579_1_plen_180_part_00